MKKMSMRMFLVLAVLVVTLTSSVSADVGYLGPAATYTE